MDKSLSILCQAIKKIIGQLKPSENALSYTLMIGKKHQGQSTLLRQSNLQHVHLESESAVELYFNQHGIIVALGETWLSQSRQLLQNTLKQLNRCHHSLKLSGIMICVDINDVFSNDPHQINETTKIHMQMIHRFGRGLDYQIDLALLFTKLDSLAGFCEFYQNEHQDVLKRPLGFSHLNASAQALRLCNYKKQFEQFIEILGQQVITKVHPVRSSLKRTLIREFPLQMASLEFSIQSLVQSIPAPKFRLQAIFFTSAEQGGISRDRLNEKIKHEYALSVQDTFHQSVNYRPYFIDGAITTFQKQTKRPIPRLAFSSKWFASAIAGVAGLSLLWLGYQHVSSYRLLDEVSKALLTYESTKAMPYDGSPAEFYLAKAANAAEHISPNLVFMPSVQAMKATLRANTQHLIKANFLPTVVGELEEAITNVNASHASRYQALKIYLMLANPAHYSQSAVMDWFSRHWKPLTNDQREKRMSLLKEITRKPMQPIAINQQLVNDSRNYFNSLPASYLYYSLAKEQYPKQTSPVEIPGFELVIKQLPVYYTKAGFKDIINQLPGITQTLQQEQWVLARKDTPMNLATIIQQAYAYDYATVWKQVLAKSRPLPVHDYKQAVQLSKTLVQSRAMTQLINLIKEQTSPDFDDNSTLFNQYIASQFAELNLLSQSTLNDLSSQLNELEIFVNTLSAINDNGKTAFTFTRSRFNGDVLTNPLTALYNRSKQLPAPVSHWVRQLADDCWYLLIKDTRNYVNEQWQTTVFDAYQRRIAKRYPFDSAELSTVAINDFEHFFATHGVLNNFLNDYLKPFLDTSQPLWQPKQVDNYALPISSESLNELMRANIITTMFFPAKSDRAQVEFSLQKINLDPAVADLQITVGNTQLKDTQDTASFARFMWPQSDASLQLASIDGEHYELSETGPWAFFKLLQKLNVLAEDTNRASLQILFNINGNSGRYVLKTNNQINPFIPGILHGFKLPENIA